MVFSSLDLQTQHAANGFHSHHLQTCQSLLEPCVSVPNSRNLPSFAPSTPLSADFIHGRPPSLPSPPSLPGEGFREGENCPWGNRKTVGNGSNESEEVSERLPRGLLNLSKTRRRKEGNKRTRSPNGTVGAGERGAQRSIHH